MIGQYLQFKSLFFNHLWKIPPINFLKFKKKILTKCILTYKYALMLETYSFSTDFDNDYQCVF